MNLSALADFNLVVVHGGFSQASRATGRSKATLSRKVMELEQSLGVQLIKRGSKALHLTEEGQNLFARTEQHLSEIIGAGEMVSAGVARPSGKLRVCAPVLFAHVALGKIAAEFIAIYPEVELEIIAEDRMVDPIEEGFDLVIRVNPKPDDKLIGRCILKDNRIVAASPALPRPPLSGTARVPSIALSFIRTSENWRIMDGKHDLKLIPEPVLSLSSILMVRDAVKAGAGVALLPRELVAKDLEAGTIVSWGAVAGHHVELWILYSSHRLVNSKVTAFVDFLISAFPSASLSDSIT